MRLKITKLNSILQVILFYMRDYFNNNINIIVDDKEPYDYEIIYLDKMIDIDPTKLYISYFETDLNIKNILSLYHHLNMIDIQSKINNDELDNSTDEPIICFFAYITHTFLLLSTNIMNEYPIILDPISSITHLLHTNKSLSRFGDGEISASNGYIPPHGETNDIVNFKDEFNQILKNENKNLFIALCDIFYPTCKPFWDINEYTWWFHWSEDQWPREMKAKFNAPDKTLYLNANISRIRHYPIIKPNKYFEYYAKLFLNKDIVVVCNKTCYTYFLGNLLFPAHNIIFVIVKETNCSSDADFIYNSCIDYGKNKPIFMHTGAFATYMANKLSQINYRCIDTGSFQWNREPHSKDFLCSIQNLLYKFNYKINTDLNYKSNNECDILDSGFIIDDNRPLIITQTNVNNTGNDSPFNIHFNLPLYLYKCSNTLCNIKISTNQKCTLFTGVIAVDIDKSYDCDMMFDLNNWHIIPSFETNEFIIYDISMKVLSFT